MSIIFFLENWEPPASECAGYANMVEYVVHFRLTDSVTLCETKRSKYFRFRLTGPQ